MNAPPGQVFVCLACGRTSRNRAGTDVAGEGWDESCMLNARLCRETDIERNESGRVVKVRATVREPHI